jgi:hypothetical protein
VSSPSNVGSHATRDGEFPPTPPPTYLKPATNAHKPPKPTARL